MTWIRTYCEVFKFTYDESGSMEIISTRKNNSRFKWNWQVVKSLDLCFDSRKKCCTLTSKRWGWHNWWQRRKISPASFDSRLPSNLDLQCKHVTNALNFLTTFSKNRKYDGQSGLDNYWNMVCFLWIIFFYCLWLEPKYDFGLILYFLNYFYVYHSIYYFIYARR